MSKREGSNTRLRESSLTSSQNQIEILPIEIVLSTLTTHPATPKLYLLNPYITHNSSYTYKTADIHIQQLSRTHIAAHIHVQKKERNKKKKIYSTTTKYLQQLLKMHPANGIITLNSNRVHKWGSPFLLHYYTLNILLL